LNDAEISVESSGYVVREKGRGTALFRFDAVSAVPIDSDTILATVAEPKTAPSQFPWNEVSIYLITVSTQRVTYIATQPVCQLVSGSAEYVAWTEGRPPDDGKVRVYDRETGEISKLDVAFGPLFAANGMLGNGPVNLRRLIDLKTLQYYAILPSDGRGTFVNWSPDFRFASTGNAGSTASTC
jgi:hypothetical protein